MTEETSTTTAQPVRSREWLNAISFRRIGAVYVLLVIWVVFSLIAPTTFPQFATFQQIANANAVAAIVALGLALPASAGLFDVSFPYVMTLAGVISAKLVLDLSAPVPVAYITALLAAAIVGLVNAVVLVRFKIESLVGTLATGALVAAAISWITGDYDVAGVVLSAEFAVLGQKFIGGFNLTVFVALVLAVLIWLFLEHTATGRRTYAVGFNYEASRLAGIHGDRIRTFSLVACSLIAGCAGILLASRVASAGVHAGAPYLLPAFAAVFLGSTQFKNGRVNAWGTVVAVLLLGTGATGLGLAGAPLWASSFFTGVVLIAALTIGSVQRKSIAEKSTSSARSRLVRTLFGRRA